MLCDELSTPKHDGRDEDKCNGINDYLVLYPFIDDRPLGKKEAALYVVGQVEEEFLGSTFQKDVKMVF